MSVIDSFIRKRRHNGSRIPEDQDEYRLIPFEVVCQVQGRKLAVCLQESYASFVWEDGREVFSVKYTKGKCEHELWPFVSTIGFSSKKAP